MEKSTFGKRLGVIMQKRGIGRTALKDLTGISLQSISNYLNDKRKPDCEMIAELSRALNVSADYLLGLSDIPTRNETIQGIHEKTGLWQESIITLMVDSDCEDDEISDFISYLTVNKQVPDLIKAIKRKNEFSAIPQTVSIDIGGGYYGADMQALFKMIASDIFFEIIDGYTAKPGEIMVGYKVGESNG